MRTEGHERIDLTDTMMSALMKLAEGNPGALTAIAEMIKTSPIVDPLAAFGSFGPLLSLDSHGIYGSRIWMLYSDVCQRNAVDALMLLRCVQMGILHENRLSHAIDRRGDGIDLSALRIALKEELPSFVLDGNTADAMAAQI